MNFSRQSLKDYKFITAGPRSEDLKVAIQEDPLNVLEVIQILKNESG